MRWPWQDDDEEEEASLRSQRPSATEVAERLGHVASELEIVAARLAARVAELRALDTKERGA